MHSTTLTFALFGHHFVQCFALGGGHSSASCVQDDDGIRTTAWLVASSLRQYFDRSWHHLRPRIPLYTSRRRHALPLRSSTANVGVIEQLHDSPSGRPSLNSNFSHNHCDASASSSPSGCSGNRPALGFMEPFCDFRLSGTQMYGPLQPFR